METRTRTRREIAATLEATALAPDTSADDVRRLCAVAVREGTRAVCVPLEHVRLAREELDGAGPMVVTVAGFPRGDDPPSRKVAEVGRAAEHGADEVDVVLAHHRLAAGDHEAATVDVVATVDAAHGAGLAVKIILETGALGPGLLRVACGLAVDAGADWVKTCTGFGPRGATVADVMLMRSAVGERVRIKAAGGIRDRAQAVALLDAGADTLGCSAVAAVLDDGPA